MVYCKKVLPLGSLHWRRRWDAESNFFGTSGMADDFLILPDKASLDPLQNILNQLEEHLHDEQGSVGASGAGPKGHNSMSPSSMGPSPTGHDSSQSTALAFPSGPNIPAATTQNLMQSEARFYQKVMSSFNHVLVYEELSAQQSALACIPLSKLESNVQIRLSASENPRELDHRDILLLELLAWFQREFFTWMNSPACAHCGTDTHAIGMAEPNAEELHHGAHRVENYRCSACHACTRFPRYNDPVRLLETRTGRCGEWANCFTLCCRAVGFEARYVLDWTDHVWTEVYSNKKQRWLHCDPCENACDRPLMYEAGWNKKLSYILAFSVDDIQDVTWRYSSKHAEVLTRRTECRESWLLGLILRLRKQRQQGLPAHRQTQLKQRLVVELVEFLQVTVKLAADQERVGRVSGSIEWRTARGEIGDQPITTERSITPTALEVKDRLIHLCYCCATDCYTRSHGIRLHGWQSLVHTAENVMRKEELDWGMVYLARTAGSSTATISWRLDLHGSGMVIDRIEVKVSSQTFENGCISWRMCSDDHCVLLPSDGHLTTVEDLAGAVTFTITATLSRGQGDVAWQHTQLFRQESLDATPPMDIKVFLKPQ